MGNFSDDPLGLDPLSPLPLRDPLSERQTAMAHSPPIPAPRFPGAAPGPARGRSPGRGGPLAPRVLRTRGFLRPEVAQRVADWFTGTPAAPAGAVRRAYRALEHETARLFEIVHRARSSGGFSVRVSYVRDDSDPCHDAAELCAELREHGSMTLTTIASEAPRPLLGGREGGVVAQLRFVHDVFGHAALGVGFELQSEFATWLPAARCSPMTRAVPRSASSSERRRPTS